MKRAAILDFARRLFLAAALVLGGITAAVAEPPLSGEYDATGRDADGAYTGQVKIAAHGEGYAIAWRLDRGNTYRGMALKMDNVLGAVFWADKDRFNGLGIVVYRIDGGELQGIWLPTEGGNATGRENLKGPPDLSGDYQITLGENPDNLTNYDGHVRMERRGDLVRLTWYTPGLSAIGNGVRVGDILVVGYASGRAPGTLGYCVGTAGLQGLWTYGNQTTLGTEALTRRDAAVQSPPGDSQGAATCPPMAAAQ